MGPISMDEQSVQAECTIRVVTKSVMFFRFSNSRKTSDVISYMGVKITMLQLRVVEKVQIGL